MRKIYITYVGDTGVLDKSTAVIWGSILGFLGIGDLLLDILTSKVGKALLEWILDAYGMYPEQHLIKLNTIQNLLPRGNWVLMKYFLTLKALKGPPNHSLVII